MQYEPGPQEAASLQPSSLQAYFGICNFQLQTYSSGKGMFSLTMETSLRKSAGISAHHAVFPLCGSKALCASASPGPDLGWSAPERVPRSGESWLRTGRKERRAKAWEKGALGQQKRGAGSETETALRSGAGETLQELDSLYRGLAPYREHLHLCQAPPVLPQLSVATHLVPSVWNILPTDFVS